MTWPEKPLGELANLNLGRTPPRKNPDYWTDDLTLPFLTIAEMDGRVADPITEGVTQKAVEDNKAKIVPAGALLMSFKLTIGKVAFAAREMCTNEAIVWLDVRDGDELLTEFLACALEGIDLTKGQSRAVKGNTLNKTSMKQIKVPVPPVPVQRRIIDLIGHIDRCREGAALTVTRSETASRALRAEALGACKNKPPLSEFAEVRMGRQRSPKDHDGDFMVPYLRSANVRNNRLDLTDVKEMNFSPEEQATFQLSEGDVLVTEGSGSIEEVGASAVWRGELKKSVMFQNTLIRLRPRQEDVEPRYLLELARWAYESGTWLDIASGTNIKHIGSTRAAKATMPLLAPSERARLIAQTRAVDAHSTAGRQVERGFSQVRASALSSLLSGEMIVPESYDRFLEEVAA